MGLCQLPGEDDALILRLEEDGGVSGLGPGLGGVPQEEAHGHGGSPGGGGHQSRHRGGHWDGQGGRVTALRGATLTFVSVQGTRASCPLCSLANSVQSQSD